jgi:adenylate cyclase
MPDLIARGPDPADSWRRQLPADEPVVLGSADGAWAVPWDPFVSRRHAELTWRNNRLKVRKVAGATNPLFHNGRPSDAFEVQLGGAFVIGRTVFAVAESVLTPHPADSPPLLETRTIAHHELNRLKFRDAPHRLDVLSKLPDVIGSATNDADLFARLVGMLLAGIARADAVAIVEVEHLGQHGEPGASATGDGSTPVADAPGPPDPGSLGSPEPAVHVLHWDRRLAGEGPFEPSRKLVAEAVAGRDQTVLHVWTDDKPAAADAPQYTLQGQFDWAFCTPVHGEGCRGWGLYVAGRLAGDAAATLLAPWHSNELRDDVKFTELVADILGSLRQVQVLRERQAVFRRFFSPGVLAVVSGGDAARALVPREADVTVLFCDLRGFSKTVEEAADELLDVLRRVSAALGVMTRNILDHGGAIADFLGDAAMGFWGWPLDQPGKVEYACRAALGIRAAFEEAGRDPAHPLSGFRAGVGVASGRAVAGGIGTPEQAKVTVFGPVVNLASRLQDMTKPLRVPILLDEPTAAVVRDQLPREVVRVRRLAKVRPFGLETPLVVTELVPAEGPGRVLTGENLTDYEAALGAFLAGDWGRAYELLHRLPPQDRGKDLLTGFILQHNHAPPPGWDGVIPLSAKT